MKDTNIAIKKTMQAMMRKKTGEERMKMGFSMFEFSKMMVLKSLLEKEENQNPQNLKKNLILNFYGNDLLPKEKEKVLEYFSNL